MGDLCPGSREYFWVPTAKRGRLRNGFERWRGPATAIAKQGASRYFVAYRSKILLIAREQMRHATNLEHAAAERITDDMDLVTQDPDRSGTYQDVTDEDVRPPTVPLRMAGVPHRR